MSDPEATAVVGRFRIVNALGLHARAATKLTRLASTFRSDITIAKDGQPANAKSIMGVLLLCGSCGSEVEITATGADAPEAINAIGQLIAGRFGEEQ